MYLTVVISKNNATDVATMTLFTGSFLPHWPRRMIIDSMNIMKKMPTPAQMSPLVRERRY
jgi:hypothetical protein